MIKIKLDPNKKLSYEEFVELLQNAPKVDYKTELFVKLKHFELKYQMSSEEFYEKYRKGEMPDKHEFSVWASTYQTYCGEVRIVNHN